MTAALDAPGVRRALRTYQRNAFGLFVGGLALLLVFVWGADRVETRREELERTGRRLDGAVVRVRDGRLDVRFLDGGAVRTARIHLDDESPHYEVGQPVLVLVDPDDEHHLSVPGETNQSPWTIWPMVVALIGGAMAAIAGGWSLVRALRQRRRLRRGPWRRVTFTYREVARPRNSVRALVLVREAGVDHLVTVASSLKRRLRRSGLRSGREADIVGDLSSDAVLRVVGSNELVSVRPPRTDRGARRWRRELDEAG
jgi:hypothetical protein